MKKDLANTIIKHNKRNKSTEIKVVSTVRMKRKAKEKKHNKV